MKSAISSFHGAVSRSVLRVSAIVLVAGLIFGPATARADDIVLRWNEIAARTATATRSSRPTLHPENLKSACGLTRCGRVPYCGENMKCVVLLMVIGLSLSAFGAEHGPVFGVHPLGDRSRPSYVREQHRDRAPLAGRRGASRGGCVRDGHDGNLS